jgi:2-dehydropantoate 2-reductase
MFCVKLWDTENAARSLLPIMRPQTGVISLQNGVTKDDMLRPIFGAQALMGGVAYVGTSIGRPGVIAQQGPLQRLVFGEYDGSRTRRAEQFLAACKAASMPSSATTCAARSGRNTSCWSRCPAPPPPCAAPSDPSAATR